MIASHRAKHAMARGNQPKNETVEERRNRLAEALKEHLAKIMKHRKEAEEEEMRKRAAANGGKKNKRSRSTLINGRGVFGNK